MSSDAQLDKGAIQETRILTGSACEAPCARSKIAASATAHVRICRMSPSVPSLGGMLMSFSDRPQPDDCGVQERPAREVRNSGAHQVAAHSSNPDVRAKFVTRSRGPFRRSRVPACSLLTGPAGRIQTAFL